MVIIKESELKEGVAVDQVQKKALASLFKEVEHYRILGQSHGQASSLEKVHIGVCLGYLKAVAQELNPLQTGGYPWTNNPTSLLNNDVENVSKQYLIPLIAHLQKMYESGYGENGKW